MSAKRTDARCLKASDTATDYQNALGRRSWRNLMGHSLLAAGRRVMAANGVLALVDAVYTVTKTNTGANAFFLVVNKLSNEVRVRHMCPCHANQVHLAVSDGVSGGR